MLYTFIISLDARNVSNSVTLLPIQQKHGNTKMLHRAEGNCGFVTASELFHITHSQFDLLQYFKKSFVCDLIYIEHSCLSIRIRIFMDQKNAKLKICMNKKAPVMMVTLWSYQQDSQTLLISFLVGCVTGYFPHQLDFSYT